MALLREAYEKNGNDQKRTAAALDVSQSLVSQALSGTKPVSVALAVALAADRGVSLDELLDLGPQAWGALPGYPEAEAAARAIFPHVRTSAWRKVASVRAAPPASLDPAKLGVLAAMFDGPIPKT